MSHTRKLRDFLVEAIRVEIFGEDALIQQARNLETGDVESPLPVETAEAVGAIIWEKGDTSAIVRASKNCGTLQAYFYTARYLDIPLPPEVMVLEEWGDTINPA